MIQRRFITRYENDIIKFNGKYYDYLSEEVIKEYPAELAQAASEWFVESSHPENRGICTGWFPVYIYTH